MNKEEIMVFFSFYTASDDNKYLNNSSYNSISDVVDKILTISNTKITELKTKVAELEAKVYTYEKIIANSNFKPILEKPKIKNSKEVKDENK